MTAPLRTPANSPARMKWADHQRLYGVIEGAVVDAFNNHSDYLTPKGEQSAVQSITKRVIGSIVDLANRPLGVGSSEPVRCASNLTEGAPRRSAATAPSMADVVTGDSQEGGVTASPSELHATRLHLLCKVANFGSSRSAPAMEARKRLKAITHELLRREMQ